jgi:hypothetical protein
MFQRKAESWKKMLNLTERTMLSHLESTKVSKNELKTNWFLKAKYAIQGPKSGENGSQNR